jgi:hypothetical protein
MKIYTHRRMENKREAAQSRVVDALFSREPRKAT